MIDHIKTANDIAIIMQQIDGLAENNHSLHAETVAEKAKEKLTKIASWHRDRGEEQQRNLNLCELAHHGKGALGTIAQQS